MGISNPLVHIVSSEIFSPLGETLSQTLSAMEKGETTLTLHNNPAFSPEPFCASLLETSLIEQRFSKIGNPQNYTRFEMIAILSADAALKKADIDPTDSHFLFIISTTKGNIELLGTKHPFDDNRVQISEAAKKIGNHFQSVKTPLLVSNACISGVLALVAAYRAIRHNEATTVAVIGADSVTPFILSGFQSFKSLSLHPAQPYDEARDGLTLGEASATIILSKKAPKTGESITISGGATANDANHISGPSRTGEGLYTAIQSAFTESTLVAKEIDMISAHGTATKYNDEMESIAFNRLGLSETPLHSLKGYFGHTLGAAGVIESAILIENMKRNSLIKTMGYKNSGVSGKINMITKNRELKLSTTLKTASGFGGTNGAIIFQKTTLTTPADKSATPPREEGSKEHTHENNSPPELGGVSAGRGGSHSSAGRGGSHSSAGRGGSHSSAGRGGSHSSAGRGGSHTNQTIPTDWGGEQIHNHPHLKTFRKDLRNNLTPAEAMLWKLLQNKKLKGRKFRRQHSVASYILDFYCPKEKLAIELDGQGHLEATQAEYDYDRTLFLNEFGIKVLRFENKEVFQQLTGVLQVIENAFGWMDLTTPADKSATPPREEGSKKYMHENNSPPKLGGVSAGRGGSIKKENSQ